MFHFINDEIKIDFPVPKDVKYLMDVCEQKDLEDNYAAYEPHVNALIDVVAKEACVQGHLTGKQWKLLERRYEL